jgi:hypothetical protein
MANLVSLASQQLVYLIPDGRKISASSTGTAGASGAGQRHQASQSYARVGKFTQIKHQRYAHTKEFNRANKALRRIR